MSLPIKFVLSVIPFLVIFFGLILFLENEKQNGTEVTLHVISRDPNDFFRGDYATLSYDISNYRTNTKPEDIYDYSKTRCLILNNNNPASVKEVVDVKEVKQDSLHICADSYWITQTDVSGFNVEEGATSTVPVPIMAYEYHFTFSNLEKFYVPANKGWAIDEAAGKGEVDAVVSVTNRGIGYIKYLTINGQKVDFSRIKEKE